MQDQSNAVPLASSRRASGHPPARSRDGSLRLVRLRDVARLLGVSVVTVRRRIREGALAHVRIAGRLYVRPQDLDVFVARHHVPDS